MSQYAQMLAAVIERSSGALAGFSTEEFLRSRPEAATRFAHLPQDGWRDWFRKLITELAAAARLENPEQFADQVQWHRQAFQSDASPDVWLQAALQCLHRVLDEQLPESARETTAQYLAAAQTRFKDPPADDSPREPGEG